ncbi:19472_t:CDS:2 [Gigaspora margarita]|uniref:19472_t:CDS:1 n=1 Tax=Gigaspora margarita TaxID=4874 RepID=A0ABM8W113_GIGMA|nr:19472_t:CDS:2 [Gigaspora margarita]
MYGESDYRYGQIRLNQNGIRNTRVRKEAFIMETLANFKLYFLSFAYSDCYHSLSLVRQEYYLLWGEKEVNKMTIDKVSSISDMFSIAYLAVLCWSIYNGYSGIKNDPNTKKNFLISAGLVALIALINVIKLAVSVLKVCFTSDTKQPPPYDPYHSVAK